MNVRNLLILLAVIFNASPLRAEQTRYLMVGLGDSISAAALANTSAGDPNALAIPGSNFKELRAVLLGESDSSFFDNKETLSWVSGSDLRSHWLRLKDALKAPNVTVDVQNAAISGAETNALGREIREVQNVFRNGRYSAIPYVTLLMGANDLCKNTPIEQVQQNLTLAFEQLSKIPKAGKIRILVSSVPRIPELGRPEIRDRETASGYTCEYIRSEVLGFCNRMTHWNSDADYRSRLAEVDRMNSILQAAAQDAARKYSNLEVAWSDSLSRQSLDFPLLAGDCFHPNAKGQATLAERLWQDQPWFK